MLLLDARTREIDGITVFPDHADPEQWYYMPAYPHLTTVRDPVTGDEVPQFLLVAYRGEAGDGGILSFDCNLGVPQAQLDAVAREIANGEHLARAPRLGPVPLVSGTVRLLALGESSVPVEGSVQPEGVPDFVLSMQHHTNPALFGTNQASFSVSLSKDGLSLVEGCLDGEILPIAVIYSLDYWGLRPAYAIKLSIDWDRVQKHLDESFSTGFWFVSTEISKAVDELVESRAIVLEADTFVPEGADTQTIIDRRDAALAMVRNMITDNFFEVSIPPWKPDGKEDWEKALDAVSKLAAGSAAMAAGGPAATTLGSISFSYKKTDYTRIDRKNLNVNLSERTTVVRSIHPQAHLASLSRTLRDSSLPREHFVKRVDLDNEYFARRRLKVAYRPGLAVSEIDSINVRASYAGQPRNAILTAPSFETSFEWLKQLDAGVPLNDVELSYDVHFKNVDASERPGMLSASAIQTVDEEAVLHPEAELFTIKPLPILAENFPWARYSSVEVQLRYTDESNAIKQEDLVRLTADKPAGEWKMFIRDRNRSDYELRVVYRALDNRDFVQEWITTGEEQVTIRNPFPTQRVVEVTPSAIDFREVVEAFVDLRYADAPNHVLVEDSFSFREGSASQRFVVDMRNPEQTEVFYTVTFIMADHTSVTIPESVTHDRRLAIRPDMKGRRSVVVRPPSDFDQRRMRRALIDVRYEDFAAGLSFADSFEFHSGAERGRFEYDFVEESRNKFEYRYSVVLENGLVKRAEWRASSDTLVAPKV